MLDDLGLIPALRWSLDRFEQRTGQAVHFKASLTGIALEPVLETTLYRIIQEALTNVARHARADQVWVELSREANALLLRIRDDGRGFEVAPKLSPSSQRPHLGIVGMRERAAILGGTLQVISGPSAGTLIEVRFPLNESMV
jgi:signal transduction histidine kinase